jgi:hypothetical protein
VVSGLHSAPLNLILKVRKEELAGRIWYGSWKISIRLAPEARQQATVATMLSQVEKPWKAIYPHEKFSFAFFDETIANLYQQERRISALMRLAMIIAIAISCMGLLGLATFTAEQRQKGIGIRKVLGASMVRIFRMLTLDFLWPVTLAFVIPMLTVGFQAVRAAAMNPVKSLRMD